MSEPELWRISAFQRAMGELADMEAAGHGGAGLTSLSPSLLADLERFDHYAGGAEVLEVVASCMRHGQNVALHLARDGYVIPITVFPNERLYHSPLPQESLLDSRLDELKLLQVEPAVLRPPGARRSDLVGASHLYHPLTPLLWSLALYGPRKTLLHEIEGPAVYRTSPGLDLRKLELRGAYAHGVYRLKDETVPLRTIASWPGFTEERAIRLLNALYLQSGLIVSRTHPAALSATTLAQSWRQFLRRRKGN